MSPKTDLGEKRWIWLIAAFAVLATGLLLPAPDGLSEAGQRSLAVLAFAVILWITEAVSYPVSAALILSLVAILREARPIRTIPTPFWGPRKP